MFSLLKKIYSYNGSLEFKKGVDDVVTATYQHQFVVERFRELIMDKRVLDAGCWTGPIASEILSQAFNVELVGIDENTEALDTARRSFPNYNFLSCSLNDPPGEFLLKYRDYFDSIIFLDVLEHLPKGEECIVLRHLNTLLSFDGAIIISTMADHVFNFVDPAWLFGHRHYKEHKLKKMLEKCGYEIKEFLKIGNIFWDFDLLLFYFYKHILRKRYKTSAFIQRQIMKGFSSPKVATRFYIMAKKRK